jgi:uncharacterized protein YndB with AHSA1/START domain
MDMERELFLALLFIFTVLAILVVSNRQLFGSIALVDSVEIKASPEEIWEFFYNLDENYKAWHPEDHVTFTWTDGKPMEMGSRFYAEEYAMGEIKQYKGEVVEIEPHRKIIFDLSFPISVMSPKLEWRIEPKDSHSVFTAITYVRAGDLLSRLLPQTMGNIIDSGESHMKQEGVNLKQYLEARH